MDQITVMIVDRLAFFRVGLREVLSTKAHFALIDCDPNHDILGTIQEITPDVVLLDIDFPSLSGLELSRAIVEKFPDTRVIVLSSNLDEQQLLEVTKTGAVAYLDKNTDVAELVEIIERTYSGEYPIFDSLVATPRVAGHLLRQFRAKVSVEKSVEQVVARLTPRETQILNYIANGNTNRQIAQVLEISEQTIKNHISTILRKLNANDRAHAVVLAMRRGCISVEEEADPVYR